MLHSWVWDKGYTVPAAWRQSVTSRLTLPQLSSPFHFPPCHFLSEWSTVCSIKSVMICKWDANPSQRSGLLEGGYLMSAFKREPSPQEETEKKKCVCPRRLACVSKCEREEKVELLKKGSGIDCSCRKMFLIYLGHRSRMGPSVSPHGRKTQSKKNNTLNLSSVQLQIGGRERERERGRQR